MYFVGWIKWASIFKYLTIGSIIDGRKYGAPRRMETYEKIEVKERKNKSHYFTFFLFIIFICLTLGFFLLLCFFFCLISFLSSSFSFFVSYDKRNSRAYFFNKRELFVSYFSFASFFSISFLSFLGSSFFFSFIVSYDKRELHKHISLIKAVNHQQIYSMHW